VRHAGRQLADGRELLGPQQLALLLLEARHRLAHPRQYVIELAVEVLGVPLPGEANGPQLLGKVGIDVLEPNPQAGDRPAQPPGDPEPADQPAQGAQESHQQEELPALLAHRLTLLCGRFHPPAVDAEQVLARAQQPGDGVRIDPPQQVARRGPRRGLPARRVQLLTVLLRPRGNLGEQRLLGGQLGQLLGRGQRRLELAVVLVHQPAPTGGRLDEVEDAVRAELPQAQLHLAGDLETAHVLGQHPRPVLLKAVDVPDAEEAGHQQHQTNEQGGESHLEQQSSGDGHGRPLLHPAWKAPV
jgi:hypothetical protein